MLCNCYWIVLYTVHVITFCLGAFFQDAVYKQLSQYCSHRTLCNSVTFYPVI